MSTALVFSAGGMYAAWEAGVWKALHGRFQPDIVVGASAGAWNAWAVAGGCDPEELVATWLDPKVAEIMRPSPNRRYLMRPDALYAKAKELHERFRPRMPFGLTLVEVPRFKPLLVLGPEVEWAHLAATASVPVFFPAVRIDGRKYVDGGVMGALPLWAAEKMGATEAIGLNVLTGLPFRALRRIIPPPRPGPALRVRLFEPSEWLGPLRHGISWKRENIERWILMGERDANRILSSFAAS